MREVAIVGAGPAGLATAIALGQAGVPCVVFDARRPPLDKACGEGVMPTGVRHLEALGARRLLDPARSRPFVGVRYQTPSGARAEARFAEGPGLAIRRTALSEALLARVGEVAAVELALGTRVEGLEPGPVLRVRGGRRPFAFVVGADGLTSRVAAWAGLAHPGGSGRRHGVRRHYAVPPWTDFVEVAWAPGVEAYVSPCGPDLVGVALLWDADRTGSPPGGGRPLFEALLGRFPVLARRLEGVPVASDVRGAGPFARRLRRRTADGVALVGDAAGYLDPLTGEGVSLALAGARALADALGPALAFGRRPDPVAMAAYEDRVERAFRAYARITRLALALAGHPRRAEAAVRLLGASPSLFRRLLSEAMGSHGGV